jgi:hypothetical protein
MGGELADRDADVGQRSLDLVAIGFAVISAIKVEEAAIPTWDLDRLVSLIVRMAFSPWRLRLNFVVTKNSAASSILAKNFHLSNAEKPRQPRK